MPYAGLSYNRLGNLWESAWDLRNSDILITPSINCLPDVYMNMGQTNDAIYLKAAKAAGDNMPSPIYYKRQVKDIFI